MEDKVLDPLNSWGKDFWKRHLKCLFWMKYLTVYLIDLLTNQFKFKDLTFGLIGFYLFGLDTERLGIYAVYGGCKEIYYVSSIQEESIGSSDPLSLLGDLSIYLHSFVPLMFAGNHKKAPYVISLAFGLFYLYDSVIRIIDVRLIQITYCKHLDSDYQSIKIATVFTIFRMVLSIWCVFGWIGI